MQQTLSEAFDPESLTQTCAQLNLYKSTAEPGNRQTLIPGPCKPQSIENLSSTVRPL